MCDSAFFFTFAPNFKEYAEEPCNCRVTCQSEND